MSEPTVLVADDVVVMQRLLAHAVKDLGFSDIVTCASSDEVEAAYRSRRIDLAFLDIQMPEKDGLTVLQEFLKDQPQAFVVMVSGQRTLDTIQKAQALGAKGFLVKPYTTAKIVDVVEKFRKGHQG